MFRLITAFKYLTNNKFISTLASSALALSIITETKTINGSAHAAIVTIDFEDLAPGLYSELDFDVVKFTSETDLGSSSQLNVRFFDSPFPTGNVLSTSNSDLDKIIATEFKSLTSFVQIENIIRGEFTTEIDVITASAFDEFGNLLGTVTQNPGDAFLTLTFPNMAKVVFNDVEGAWGNGYVIDNLKIDVPTTVPEPTSALSLLALSTLGAGSALKRKLKSSK